MHEHALEALRMHYKMLPVGLPETSSGIEKTLLNTLFTEEEAHAAVHVTMGGKTPKEVAESLGKTEEEATELLEKLVLRGIVMRRVRGDSRTYHLQMFLPGMLEFQVDRMDESLARMFEAFFPVFARELATSKTPMMRVVPTETALPLGTEVAPYERALEIVAGAKRIALAECMCRKARRQIHRACDRPWEEACLIFGAWADVYIERGIGKEATVEEANASLEQGRQAGLVRTVANAQSRPLAMCQCCPDCCGFMRCAIEFGQPETIGKSNFVPVVNKDICEGCPDCVDACPMKAISMVKGKAKLNGTKCFGCGVCIPECSKGAISLRRKAERQVHEPPKTWVHLLGAMAEDKGRSLV